MKTNLPDSPEAEQAPREEILKLIEEMRNWFLYEDFLARMKAGRIERHAPEEKTPGGLILPPWIDSAGAYGRLERLDYLLGLSEGERRFVRDAADHPSDEVNLQVFADWLEDERRPKEAEEVRRITPEDGSLLVYRFPSTEDGREEVRAFAENIREQLDEIGRRVSFVCLPSDPALGWDITLISPASGDVLVVTYPKAAGTPMVEDANKMAKDIKRQLKEAGRDVCVAALPERYDARNHGTAGLEEMGLMPASDHARFVAAVRNAAAGKALGPLMWSDEEKEALRAAAGLTVKRTVDEQLIDPLKQAMGPQTYTLGRSATVYNACVLIGKQREEIDALKTELTELLREKRERR